MAYDAQHAVEHPDTAGYVLGALDPDDLAAFEGHLATCEQCRAEVDEFGPVADSLSLAAPAAEPPDDLLFKTLAAVQYAAMAESRPAVEPELVPPKPATAARATRWWHFHWTNPLMTAVTALGAAAVTAAAFIGVQLSQITAPAVLASFNLSANPGFTGSATATVRHYSGGYDIALRPRTCRRSSTASSTSAGMRREQRPGTPSSSRRGRSTPAAGPTTCGPPPTRLTSRSCKSPSSSQATPANTARLS